MRGSDSFPHGSPAHLHDWLCGWLLGSARGAEQVCLNPVGCGGPRLLQGGQPAASEAFPSPFREPRLTGWKNSLWDLAGRQGPEPSPGPSQTRQGQEWRSG